MLISVGRVQGSRRGGLVRGGEDIMMATVEAQGEGWMYTAGAMGIKAVIMANTVAAVGKNGLGVGEEQVREERATVAANSMEEEVLDMVAVVCRSGAVVAEVREVTTASSTRCKEAAAGTEEAVGTVAAAGRRPRMTHMVLCMRLHIH